MHCGRAATPSPPRPPPSSDSTRRGRFDVRGLAGAFHVPRTVPLHFPRLADVLDRTGRTAPEPAPARPHAGGPVGTRPPVPALAADGLARRPERDAGADPLLHRIPNENAACRERVW